MLPRLLALASFCTFANSAATPSSDCVGTISSLEDVSAAVKCTTVNVNGFTVPAGKMFGLDLLKGTKVKVLGDIHFGNLSWEGPLFEVVGEDIEFDGNGMVWNGGGPFYWDGLGTNDGSTKPHPMMRIRISGTFFDVHVVNSPAQAVALVNPGPLAVRSVTVDNSQGNFPNAQSNGLPAGHNTDGFDVTGNDLIIEKCTVINQDDCVAINRGQNITLRDNYCDDGHGMSIGSITSDIVVKDVVIQGNTVKNSAQAFRIKTNANAKNSAVSGVSLIDNVATNCMSYGILITQSYPATLGEPGNGVLISDIHFFPGTTTVQVADGAKRVVVNCAAGSCPGSWKWSGLRTTGGSEGQMNNVEVLDYNL